MQGSVVWVPAINMCLIMQTTRFRWGITVNLITDVILLAVMFTWCAKQAQHDWSMENTVYSGPLVDSCCSSVKRSTCYIELDKYRWYVGKDNQHLLMTDCNLLPFLFNRRMEPGMSDDTEIEKLISYDSQMLQTPHSTYSVLPVLLFFSCDVCAPPQWSSRSSWQREYIVISLSISTPHTIPDSPHHGRSVLCPQGYRYKSPFTRR
ncbi:hypothetical protein EDB85DRAFT_1006963 [Lactarius pseudohatsudake]|nr:hypothetical protein EDB85DRAFT_1006963 [Lactarius pseudohatsudake]